MRRTRPLPALGEALPSRGNRLSRGVGKAVLKGMGWHFEGEVPNLSKCVIVAAPHTSNWDFVVAISTVLALGLDAHWIGKDTLFRLPFGWFMRFLGGIPVDRSAPGGVVEQMVEVFRERDRFVLGIAPEGTRKRVDRWKTGFYRMAHAARVPIVLGYLDYARKVVGIAPPLLPSGDIEADLAEIRAFYAGVIPKKPDQF